HSARLQSAPQVKGDVSNIAAEPIMIHIKIFLKRGFTDAGLPQLSCGDMRTIRGNRMFADQKPTR
ncbi:MAG: hypothetical protein K8F62_12755, partial [Pseudorhodoplanes sp.]|nr:hypothetical protein [Pseudorhodoplanes sp.]